MNRQGIFVFIVQCTHCVFFILFHFPVITFPGNREIVLIRFFRESRLQGFNPNDDPPTLKRYFILDGNTKCLEPNQVMPSCGKLSWYCWWKRGKRFKCIDYVIVLGLTLIQTLTISHSP